MLGQVTLFLANDHKPINTLFAVHGLTRIPVITRSERLTLGVSWQKQLTRTQRIVALDWLDERDRIDGERRNSEFLLPSVQWSRVHAENRLNVSDGFRLSLTLRGAAESLLSDTDFSQAHLAAKTVIRLSDRVRFF